METLTANQAKTKFGEMLMQAQRGPVQIQKNGKPVAVVLSCEDYEALEAMKLELIKSRFASIDEQERNGGLVDGEAFFEELESGQYD